MKGKHKSVVLVGSFFVFLLQTSLSAQDVSQLLSGLTRTVRGKKVGPEKFFIIEDRNIQNAWESPTITSILDLKEPSTATRPKKVTESRWSWTIRR